MKYTRPKDLFGGTQKLRLGDQNIYITVNHDDLGTVEIFCSIGKAGNNKQGESAAICQLVSQALQDAPDRDKAVSKLALTLRGIEGRSGGYNRGVYIKSVPDAIGWALQGYPDQNGSIITYARVNNATNPIS